MYGVACRFGGCLVVVAGWLAGASGGLASGWSVQWSPASGPNLVAVSCPSSTDCTALGSGGRLPVAVRSNGGRWTAQAITTKPGSLLGVACASRVSCIAVGLRPHPLERPPERAGELALVAGWNGMRWSVQPTANPPGYPSTPNPPVGDQSELFGVSCPSRRLCVAVGNYASLDPGEGRVPLVERWNGKHWSIQAAPIPAGAQHSGLIAVSCASATACTAVGSVEFGSAVLVERWNGEHWSIQPTAEPAGATHSELDAVSCPSATTCTAVGYVTVGPATVGYPSAAPLAERWNGKRWTIQRTPNPGNGAFLEGVSCATRTSCTAVGHDNAAGQAPAALAERWNGKKWSIQPTPHPQSASLAAVSCPSPTTCTAAGSNHGNPLIEQWEATG
jgi:hypothetical protein